MAFSLWRAVFLSDLTEAVERQSIDASDFLATLISHNAIGYPQDRRSREWTFQYYLNNARARLIDMASRSPDIVDLEDIQRQARTAKEDWSIAQEVLERAIDRFRQILSRGP